MSWDGDMRRRRKNGGALNAPYTLCDSCVSSCRATSFVVSVIHRKSGRSLKADYLDKHDHWPSDTGSIGKRKLVEKHFALGGSTPGSRCPRLWLSIAGTRNCRSSLWIRCLSLEYVVGKPLTIPCVFGEDYILLRKFGTEFHWIRQVVDDQHHY